MYGTHAPLGVVSVPMSRACTMLAERADSSVSNAPSCTKSLSSRSRSAGEASIIVLKHLSATGFCQSLCWAR